MLGVAVFLMRIWSSRSDHSTVAMITRGEPIFLNLSIICHLQPGLIGPGPTDAVYHFSPVLVVGLIWTIFA